MQEEHDRHWEVRVLDRVSKLRVSGPHDVRIAAIAAVQRGRVSRGQLLSAGLTRTLISHRLRRGHLHPVYHLGHLLCGVYCVGHLAWTELGEETAALLAAGRGALLSHSSAGAPWEILRPYQRGQIHVTVPGDTASRRAGAHFHRSTTLLPRDTRIHRGLPVTSPARTLLDLAPQLSARGLELALDRAYRSQILRPDQMEDVLKRNPRRPGSPQLRSLVHRDHTRTVTRSEAEEILLALIRRAGLPVPELNVRLHGYELDALWRQERVVTEVDGYKYHGSRRAFEDDRAKGAVLSAHGLNVVRITVRQMQHEELVVVARLAQALGWAEAQAVAMKRG